MLAWLVMPAPLSYTGDRDPRPQHRLLASGILGLGVNLTILGFGIWRRDIFFFPLGIAYLGYGVIRWAVLAFGERQDDEPLEEIDPDLVLHDGSERLARQDH